MPTWVHRPTERCRQVLTDTALTPWLARQAYSLLLRLGTPAYLWRLWSRGKVEPAYREAWPQRLAWYDQAYRDAWQSGVGQPARPVVWLHAVSLGETKAATPLIQALRQQHPGMRLLLTHGTATGLEAGRALLQAGDVQTWFPFDTPGAVRRFLRLHRPHIGVLMETEVWPNVQHVAHAMGVSMVLANARLSDKSLRQGQRLAALMRPAARALQVALAQTEKDAQRLRLMGVSDVRVCGNVKFDIVPSPTLLAQGQEWARMSARPIVLAASSREGEEPGLLDAWLARRQQHATPGADLAPRLMIVPRHPQRFDEVAAMVADKGMTLSRRSTWPEDRPDQSALAAEVWLGDSIGEMPAYYASAQVALLGGSFAPLGGQNLIEAAACGCPIVMGPHTFNFADAADMSEEAGAACRVQDITQGVTKCVQLCTSDARFSMAEKSRLFARQHQGAAHAMATLIWGFSHPYLRGNV